MAASALVTGGTGYLGRALVPRLAAAGFDVTATHLAQPPPAGPGRWRPLDLRDGKAVAGLVAEARPDVVVHTAIGPDGPDLRATAVDGSRAVAAAAAAAGARLVHLSTDALFDGLAPPYREDDQPSPVYGYGAAKAAAEEAVRAAHPDAVIVRTSLIYGGGVPGRHERVVIDAAGGRADAVFFTDEIRCPVQVDDLAAAVAELAAGSFRGVLHVAGADAVSRYEFARLVAAFHGLDPARLRSARSAETPGRRPLDCTLDLTAARSVLRTRLRGARDVLREPGGP